MKIFACSLKVAKVVLRDTSMHHDKMSSADTQLSCVLSISTHISVMMTSGQRLSNTGHISITKHQTAGGDMMLGGGTLHRGISVNEIMMFECFLTGMTWKRKGLKD